MPLAGQNIPWGPCTGEVNAQEFLSIEAMRVNALVYSYIFIKYIELFFSLLFIFSLLAAITTQVLRKCAMRIGEHL